MIPPTMKKIICISTFVILLTVAMIGLMADAFPGACIGAAAFAVACRLYVHLDRMFPHIRSFIRWCDRLAGEQR